MVVLILCSQQRNQIFQAPPATQSTSVIVFHLGVAIPILFPQPILILVSILILIPVNQLIQAVTRSMMLLAFRSVAHTDPHNLHVMFDGLVLLVAILFVKFIDPAGLSACFSATKRLEHELAFRVVKPEVQKVVGPCLVRESHVLCVGVAPFGWVVLAEPIIVVRVIFLSSVVSDVVVFIFGLSGLPASASALA